MLIGSINRLNVTACIGAVETASVAVATVEAAAAAALELFNRFRVEAGGRRRQNATDGMRMNVERKATASGAVYRLAG